MKGELVYELGRWEKEHGLINTDFYRATIFGGFGLFNGIIRNRLIHVVF